MTDDITDIRTFQKFLQNKVFQTAELKLEKITRGGNSVNFLARTGDNICFVKLLPSDDVQHIARLRGILETAANCSSFYTARLYADVPQFLNYENFCVLIMNFISGSKLKYYQLTPATIPAIIETYRHFTEVPFAAAGVVLPPRTPGELYLSNKKDIEKLTDSAKGRHRRMADKLLHYNRLFFDSAPKIKAGSAVIHGDASLNNMLCDKNRRIAFLDLELIRFGHPVEDAAELILSALLSHAVFLTPRSRIKELLCAVHDSAFFSDAEWCYGICMHFLYYISRRLRGGKLFKSFRKDWLVLQYLRKFETIYAMIKSGGSAI